MEAGWFLDQDGRWYMLNQDHNGRFGAALYGWYFEKADGKWYFMDPADKAMMLGWQFIDGKHYYLPPLGDINICMTKRTYKKYIGVKGKDRVPGSLHDIA